MGKLEILLIEDDLTTSRALSAIFSHYHFTCQTANTLVEGLKLIDQEPKFLITDVMLPDGKGTDVVHKVHKKKLKVITVVVTGIIDPVEIAEALECKPDLFLQKPIDFDSLILFLQTGE